MEHNPEYKTDKEILEMLDFIGEYHAHYRFNELKRENANLKRQMTILRRKHNLGMNDRIPKKRLRRTI